MDSSSSSNFAVDDVVWISGLCAGKGVRIYLTVDTVIYDIDMETMLYDNLSCLILWHSGYHCLEHGGDNSMHAMMYRKSISLLMSP